MPLKEADLKNTDTYKKASRQDLPRIATGKAKFWVYKDVELADLAGKKHKYPAFLALIDANGVRKFLTGKKLICKGTCGIKEERIAFEPLAGRVPYRLLKTSVPPLLGKAVWIPAGQEDDAGEGEVVEEAPPASAATLVGDWSNLVKDAKAYVAAHPERKDELLREMAVIAELLKANKASEAKPRMEQVQAILNAPQAPLKPAGGGAQAAARWNALVKRMQAAITAYPARKSDILRAGGEIQEALRAGRFDLANQLMDTAETAVSDAPAATMAPGIEYKICILNWEKAKAQVRVELGKLEVAILKEFADEPKFTAIKASLKKLDRVLGGFDGRLRDKLDEALNAASTERPQLHEQALAIVDEYLDYVGTDAFIDALDSNPFTQISVRAPLDKTLRDLARQLSRG